MYWGHDSMLVNTDRLTKAYGSVKALDQCTIGVDRGEVFGLLGPNGAGKTTLLRLLMGYLQPSSGRATIAGLHCYSQSVAVHHLVAYLPGEVRLFPRMRGRQVLEFFSRLRGSKLQLSLAIAERLSLDISRQVARMSTGMRQKLALAAIFAMGSEILILDEPTSNLDPTVRGEVASLVSEAQYQGRTILFSSHVLSEVEQICDRVAILRDGELVCQQTMKDLRQQHRIHARLTGRLQSPPESLRDMVSIESSSSGDLMIETAGELSPLLGWLAMLPLAEVTIEPVRLQAVYDRYHPPGQSTLTTREAISG